MYNREKRLVPLVGVHSGSELGVAYVWLPERYAPQSSGLNVELWAGQLLQQPHTHQRRHGATHAMPGDRHRLALLQQRRQYSQHAVRHAHGAFPVSSMHLALDQPS